MDYFTEITCALNMGCIPYWSRAKNSERFRVFTRQSGKCSIFLEHDNPPGLRIRRDFSLRDPASRHRLAETCTAPLRWVLWIGHAGTDLPTGQQGRQNISPLHPWVSMGGMCRTHLARLFAADEVTTSDVTETLGLINQESRGVVPSRGITSHQFHPPTGTEDYSFPFLFFLRAAYEAKWACVVTRIFLGGVLSFLWFSFRFTFGSEETRRTSPEQYITRTVQGVDQ